MNRRLMGLDAEGKAAKFLQGRGYRIIARNYRTRRGELDIVALEGGEMAFVEVKVRRGDSHGSALEAVTTRKKRRIALAAAQFLAERGLTEAPCRFDVVALDGGPGGGYELVRNAFYLHEIEKG